MCKGMLMSLTLHWELLVLPWAAGRSLLSPHAQSHTYRLIKIFLLKFDTSIQRAQAVRYSILAKSIQSWLNFQDTLLNWSQK